ncbi:MAG: DASS family sodium-coupled anion symporter [Alphaproteobacteria bacterium]|nr:DASS family sodium-coupled anion symporter [Alphaproteobacteria bacterium]
MSLLDSSPVEQDQPVEAALPRLFGIGLGIVLFLIPLITPAPAGMPLEAWRVTAVVLLMATWWMTEAIPIAATALVPLVLFPLLGVASIKETAAPFADPIVYMMLGGFMIGLAMQRSNLHRRIALNVLRVAGRKPHMLVGGFMFATALLSMWISNTATAAMMLPIGMSVVGLLKQDENLQARGKAAENLPVALLLGIAFGAGIGGIGTLIGTPPNAVLAGFIAQHADLEVTFVDWMKLGIPTSLILLFLSWIVLTKIVFPVGTEDLVGARRLINTEKEALGNMKPAEKRVGIIFLCTALAWMLRPLIADVLPAGIELTDAGIAMVAAIALFLTPEHRINHERKLLDWGSTRDLPWNVMVLIGGGLALGSVVQSSGLAGWVGDMFANLDGLPVPALAMLGAVFAMGVSHVTSNTATAATLVPLSVSIALTVGAPPMMMAIPVAMACSCAFMMPVATPPNAIVFASGILTVGQMAKAGAVLGLISLVVIALMVFTVGQWVFG